MLCSLLLSLLSLSLTATGEQISSAPAYYPRLATLLPLSPSGTPFTAAVVETPTPALRRLVLLTRSLSGAWVPGSVVASAPTDAAGSVDLANGHLLQLPNGTLLCAYRHHNGTGAARTYRLQLAASSDLGQTWQLAATITSGPTGVWEPFLFLDPAAVPSRVRVAYAAELTNGGEQDIVLRSSSDGGASWGPIDSRLHTPGSRNGMPGVAVLPADGSLLLVCEGFWGNAWGHFAVGSARSWDGGATWLQHSVVHAPAAPANAGSPQVAVHSSGSSVCAVFMSSEGGSQQQHAWPDGAHTVLLCAAVSAANASQPIDWQAAAPRVLGTATPFSYWPSFLPHHTGGLGVAYQGSDSAAYYVEQAAAPQAPAACGPGGLCNLNGLCSSASGACQCYPPWGGATCGLLQLLPLAAPAAWNGFPGAAPPNASTWGGNAVPYQGQWHGYFSEVVNNCTLAQWGSNSQCVHAISSTPGGPYVRAGTAVPAWCHLPHITLLPGAGPGSSDLFALWHAGLGTTPPASLVQCSASGAPLQQQPPQPPQPLQLHSQGQPNVIHTAPTPYGPWTLSTAPIPDCWSPSPLRLRNGTFLALCGFTSLWAAPGLLGPWVHVLELPQGSTPGDWEDPLLWQDVRGGLHAFFHAYTMDGVVPYAISGHCFSQEEGLAWLCSDVQPYGGNASVSDGSVLAMSTRERPKLLFDPATGQPTHLVTAVCPVPQCAPQAAIQCKVQGVGPHQGYWTHTLVQELNYTQ